VSPDDVLPTDGAPAAARAPTIEITDSHLAQVGALHVRRALPRRARRTVGAWCFADHLGPTPVTEAHGVDIGPHPHIGLQTVTWLVAGEILHRDSLGSEQVIHPGQLNLMTAGRGVAHAEEATGRYRGDLHGMQLWVAQPERTRHDEPAFEHHAALPKVELDHGEVTVIVGDLGGVASPARRDTEHGGAELALRPGVSGLPLRPAWEHALIVLSGAVSIGADVVEPGHLAYLGLGRDEIACSAAEPTRAILLGGVPFDEPILMWWNFVARTRDEITGGFERWQAGDEWLGPVASPLERIGAPTPPWLRPSGAEEPAR
jgi:redox-sensitive bicupin YhaK (pirin superfamily)